MITTDFTAAYARLQSVTGTHTQTEIVDAVKSATRAWELP